MPGYRYESFAQTLMKTLIIIHVIDEVVRIHSSDAGETSPGI